MKHDYIGGFICHLNNKPISFTLTLDAGFMRMDDRVQHTVDISVDKFH